MRQATQELQRDLGETREEIKRGVLELPEEARESADAMRRVVGDQIKALSELSEIINRHGKTLDLSSPALGEPRPAQPRSIEMQPVARPSVPSRSRPGPSWRPVAPSSRSRAELSESAWRRCRASPRRRSAVRDAPREQRQWRRSTAGIRPAPMQRSEPLGPPPPRRRGRP